MAPPSRTKLFPRIHHLKKRAFLLAYAECGQLEHACRAVGMDHSMHYYWQKTDAAYKDAYAEAKDIAAHTLEDEAIRRARDGVKRPVYYLGGVIGEELVYSDTLLIFLLKGAMPERYGQPVQANITLRIQQAAQKVADELGIDMQLVLREAQDYLLEAKRASTA
jgi:hypothetical protein